MITLTCLYSKTFFPLNILLASLFNVYFQSRVFGGLNDDTLVEMPFWRHTIRTGKAAEGCALSSESVDEILWWFTQGLITSFIGWAIYNIFIIIYLCPNASCPIHQQLTIPGQHLYIMRVLSNSSNNQLQQTLKPLKKRGIKLTGLASYSQPSMPLSSALPQSLHTQNNSSRTIK